MQSRAEGKRSILFLAAYVEWDLSEERDLEVEVKPERLTESVS